MHNESIHPAVRVGHVHLRVADLDRAYLSDPDGNGVELYYDRPRADWFDASGRPVVKNERFDPHDLLEASARS